ncbi:MAG: DUF6677 family protein [Planctomycetota bacterium]
MPSRPDNPITLLEHSTFDRLLAAVLTWLVPGAGYWLLGYRTRAVLFAVLLLGLFWTGEILLAGNGDGQFMAVTYEVHPVFFVLESGNGLSAFLANFIWGAAAHADGLHDIMDMPRHLNLGILLCVISGMLNVLLVLNVLDKKTWQLAGEKALTPRGNEGDAE